VNWNATEQDGPGQLAAIAAASPAARVGAALQKEAAFKRSGLGSLALFASNSESAQ
jgi:hypothetical protein